jgi:DNA invertase Pin-like site-specific DNA recombinase
MLVKHHDCDERDTAPILVAEYRRASDERQEFSTQNQSVVNRAYATAHRMTIIRTYSDEGKSGLNFHRRHALKRLIAAVEAGNCDFKAILVYDVSRWGRFQDPDESCYYEHICKRAGIKVHYCAEQFDNDGSPLAAMAKSVKRAMAAEYSRELSVKVFAGLARLVGLGFYTGGPAPYGTRRLLVDPSGKPKCLLTPGERKSLQADRVVLVPGPPHEIKIVKWIFSTFVKGGKSETTITRILNKPGKCIGLSRRWTYDMVHKILQSDIYVGNSIWNRTSWKLGRKRIRNPPCQWLHRKWAFAPIVERRLFDATQVLIRKRWRRFSKKDVLEALRRLNEKHGFLDMKLIAQDENLPTYVTLHRLFGGLNNIYRSLGSTPRLGTRGHQTDDQLLACLGRLRERHGYVSWTIVRRAKGIPSITTFEARFGSLRRAFQMIGYEPDPNSPRSRAAKTRAMSHSQLLDALRYLLRARGRLSDGIIRKSRKTPAPCTYQRRFGSLNRAYELIGYNPKCQSRSRASL